MFKLWNIFGSNNKNLTCYLRLGENFAIKAEDNNDEGIELYLLVCWSQLYVVRKPFNYPWREKFTHQQLACYYQKCGKRLQNYVYKSKFQITYWHVEDIRAVNFPMIPQACRVTSYDLHYVLPIEVEDWVRQIMRGLAHKCGLVDEEDNISLFWLGGSHTVKMI